MLCHSGNECMYMSVHIFKWFVRDHACNCTLVPLLCKACHALQLIAVLPGSDYLIAYLTLPSMLGPPNGDIALHWLP